MLLTNYTTGHRGIKGHYKIHECGGKFERTIGGNYTSPNFPDEYPVDTICKWTFNADYGVQLELVFDTFELEDSVNTNCNRDHLIIKNGAYASSPVLMKTCGDRNPGKIKSASNSLIVIFKSDSLITSRGFSFEVKMVEQGCGGWFHGPSGVLKSPGYPQKYTRNTECVWTIELEPSYHLNFTFIGRFDIEMHSSCLRDYLLIEEWINDDWVTINRFCGLVIPKEIKTQSHKARVTFRSNDNIEGDGFQLNYRRACGSLFTEREGLITSPGYPTNYANLLNCEFLIQTNPTDFVVLDFEDDFNLEKSTNCIYDSLVIYKGKNRSVESVGPYCNSGNQLIICSFD